MKIIPIFIPHLGCPHDCLFCNQKKITGLSERIEPSQLASYVLNYIGSQTRDAFELAFYGGSFTGIDTHEQIAYLSEAHRLMAMNVISKIRVSTRPDFINDDVLGRLRRYGVSLVELGCQSFDSVILSASKRGHDEEDIYRAVNLLREHGIDVGVQLMLGLPGDTLQTARQSLQKAIALKPACIRLYPTLVIPDTGLNDAYMKGLYQPWTLEASVDFCAYALKECHHAKIPVIRMGLQASEGLVDVVAGPKHDAFGAHVWSKLFYDALVKACDFFAVTDFTVTVNTSQSMYVSGQERVNHHKLSHQYGHIRFRVKQRQDWPMHAYLFECEKGSLASNIMK